MGNADNLSPVQTTIANKEQPSPSNSRAHESDEPKKETLETGFNLATTTIESQHERKVGLNLGPESELGLESLEWSNSKESSNKENGASGETANESNEYSKVRPCFSLVMSCVRE